MGLMMNAGSKFKDEQVRFINKVYAQLNKRAQPFEVVNGKMLQSPTCLFVMQRYMRLAYAVVLPYERRPQVKRVRSTFAKAVAQLMYLEGYDQRQIDTAIDIAEVEFGMTEFEREFFNN